MVGANVGRALYDDKDPFCQSRVPNDKSVTLDHFYTKLLTLTDTMQTEAGSIEAKKRTDFMRSYLRQLKSEIESSG